MRTGQIVIFSVLALGASAAPGLGCGGDTDDADGKGSGGDAAADGDADNDADADAGGNPARDAGSDPDAGFDPPVCAGRVLVSDVTNARDLGGAEVGGGNYVACGRILRGGELTGLGADACARFTDLGIQTVIDLREPEVFAGQPPVSCVSDEAKVVSAAMPKLLPPSVANYLALLEEGTAIRTIFEVLGDPANYPVYIHCVIGRDRASFATALVLMALGASRQAIVSEFLRSNNAGVTVDRTWIEAVIDAIEAEGGIETFLAGVGVTSGQIQGLKNAALLF